MHEIRKYANNRMYDVTEKKYTSLDRIKELVTNGEKVSIVDKKTGDDITDTILSKIKPEIDGTTNSGDTPPAWVKKIQNWIGDVIDQRINQALDMMKLASKEQITALTREIESLTKKVEQLEKLSLPAPKKKSPARHKQNRKSVSPGNKSGSA